MRRFVNLLFFLFFYSFFFSQQIGVTGDEKGMLYRDEWNVGAFVHTNGYGLNFHAGRWTSYRTRNSVEVQFTHFKHPEETRRKNIYQTDNAKSFIYGKLYHVNNLQVGISRSITINEKPYWGGVDVRWFWSGGGQLAWLVPVYLQIIHKSSTSSFSYITVERYDPGKHTLEDIYSRSNFWTGINESVLYPGLYLQGGFCFDYSQVKSISRLLEVGLMLNYSPIPIKIMAHAPSQNIFINAYLGLQIGKKYFYQRYAAQ